MPPLLAKYGKFANWPLTAPQGLLTGHVSPRSPSTSYSETDAETIAAGRASPGPLPRNAFTDSWAAPRRNRFRAAGPSRPADLAKPRQPGAALAGSTRLASTCSNG